MPRKAINPATSVTVVRMMEDAVAGSCPSRDKIIGTKAPEIPAIIMAVIMAIAMTRAMVLASPMASATAEV